MNGTRMRLTLAFLVVVGAILFVAGGSAGPRAATATFAAFPGPGLVTYDELIAYKGEFTTRSQQTLNHVRLRQTIPVAGGETAEFDSSTCPSPMTPTPDGSGIGLRLRSGSGPDAKIELTILWRVPTLASTSNCPNCLVSTGYWTVNEGINDNEPPDPNDVFGVTETKATLLASGEGTQETLRAGGYETAPTSCAVSSPGNLRTHDVISLANPVSTKFCLPSFVIPVGNGNLGFASTITETLGNPHVTEICIAALGTNCGASHVDATFGAPYVTHIIRVADAALGNDRITEVSHNGEVLPLCEDEPDNANGCLVEKPKPQGNPKIWVIVAKSPTNGPWDW